MVMLTDAHNAAPSAVHYSMWLTEPKAIALAGISVGLLFLILLYFIVSTIVQKIPKVKAKTPKAVLWLFRPGWATWLAFILAFIVGLIYYSLSKEFNFLYNPQDPNDPFNGKLWVWQSIQFLYSIGSWIVIFILFTLWLSAPFMAIVSFSKMYEEKQNYTYHLKRLLWILIMLGVTLGAANLMWVFPINSHYTSLEVFHINHNHQDYFYISAKEVYEHVFLTKWYAWVFLGYCALCILVGWVLAYLGATQRIRNAFSKKWIYKDTVECFQNKFSVRFNHVKSVFMLPFTIANSLSALEFYAFFVAFSLFNIASLWLHITFILVVCLIAYVVIVLVTIVYGIIKYTGERKVYLQTVGGLLWQFIKPFFFIKHNKEYDFDSIKSDAIRETYNKNKNTPSINISLNIVVPVAFTVFLGFNNLPHFDTWNQVGTYSYGPIMHQATFWITLIASGFLFNYMYVGVSDSNSYGKNIVGAATYAITPGMQTGVLGTLSSTLGHFAKWTDYNLKLVF